MAYQAKGIEGLLADLSVDAFCADAYDAALDLVELLLPPEKISTTDCAIKDRRFSNPEGGGTRPWLLSRSPYMRGPQDGMDDPRCRMVIVVGPERGSKSVGGENYLFKSLKYGPHTETIIFLPPGDYVKRYTGKEFGELFSLHPDIAAKVGGTPSQNSLSAKQVFGKWIRVLAMVPKNFTQLEAPLIIASEIDSTGKFGSRLIQDIKGRQKSMGNASKAYIESHPDQGADGPIVSGFKSGSRAVMYWSCPHCLKWSTPHQLAPVGMLSKMWYDRDDSLSDDERMLNAKTTAALECPHCTRLIADGPHQKMINLIDDQARYKMIDNAVWVDGSSSIDADGSVTGSGPYNPVQSFWFHGYNVKRPLAELAEEHLLATLHFQTTRKRDLLKRHHIKSLGEVDEGPMVVKSSSLKQRAEEAQEQFGFERGTFPRGFKLVVAAVDQGARKFDAAWYAFDLEGRSALLDRITIRDRVMPDGSRRDIRPAEAIEDWMQLQKSVIERRFVMQDDATKAMPVAIVAIDTGGTGKRDKNDLPDGATYKAREFARRMSRAGKHWGVNRYPVVKLFKGFASKDDRVILAQREINIDEHGKAVAPVVIEFNVNVNRTKAISLNRLGVTDGGPGQCYFANDLPNSVFTELTAETWTEGDWIRRGDNETWDLFGYCEALRVLLDPDNERYNWNSNPPIWAKPIDLNPKIETAEKAKPKLSVFDKIAANNEAGFKEQE